MSSSQTGYLEKKEIRMSKLNKPYGVATINGIGYVAFGAAVGMIERTPEGTNVEFTYEDAIKAGGNPKLTSIKTGSGSPTTTQAPKAGITKDEDIHWQVMYKIAADRVKDNAFSTTEEWADAVGEYAASLKANYDARTKGEDTANPTTEVE